MGFLSSVTDSLFGSSPDAEVTQAGTKSRTQQAAVDGVLRALGISFDEISGDPTFGLGDILATVPRFTGDLTAENSDILERLFADAATGDLSTLNPARDILVDIVNADPTDFQDFFRSAVADPAREEFLEETLPELDAAFRAADPFGSDRGRAINEAFEDFSEGLTGARERFAFETSESQRNRALTAATELADLGVIETQILQNLGATETALDQATLDRELALFLDLEDRRARRIQEILGFASVGTMENIATVTPGSGGLLGGLASGIGFGIGGGLF